MESVERISATYDVVDEELQSLMSSSPHLMSALDPDIALPRDKLTLKSNTIPSSDTQRNVYVALVANGSFNPPTFMHLRCFELARDALNSQGFCVIGGYISPVNDAYKKKGLVHARHHVTMCDLACRSSSFIMVDSWEDNIKIVDEVVLNGINSTRLRDCISSGQSAKYLTADEVIDYTKQNNLYIRQREDDQIKCLLLGTVFPGKCTLCMVRRNINSYA